MNLPAPHRYNAPKVMGYPETGRFCFFCGVDLWYPPHQDVKSCCSRPREPRNYDLGRYGASPYEPSCWECCPAHVDGPPKWLMQENV